MMLSSSPGRRPPLLWATLLVLLSVTLLPLLPATPAVAALTDGALRIEPIAAYNFVVDSNVLSPSTYAPEAGTLGAKVCNDGATTLTDIYVYIGDRGANTPGIYPSRGHPGLQGSYSLTHEGGSAGANDASRYIPALGPGQCAMQYWLVSYPRTGPSDGSVVGAAGSTVAVTLAIKPDDDLYLFYDMWASATDGAATRNVDVTRRVTMRNEISAAANKIWPNTTSKVPDEYLQAIATALGWDTLTPSGSTVAYPGETVTTQGIWYDLGNVGFGFDNNGDGVPDQNAWLQPIGDPNSYDPGCFRLVRSYGILIIKLKSGGEQLIPFVDQLYFESIPENTGVVGLVYYQYAALDGSCTAGLSPYQEVASGYDNEKFSGDYGFGIPPLQSRTPAFTLLKSVSPTGAIPATINGTTLTYGISFQNTGPVAIGDPSLGIPLVIGDAIPAGTTYVANSATAVGATVSPGVQVARIRYSTDGGATWTNTQPAAASVTNVQWWLSAPLPAGASGAVSFQVTAPRVANIASIPNTATASFGTAPPFAESTVRTPVAGNNSIAGTVYQDTGTGTGEFANDTLNAGETGRFANVPVTLILRTSSGDITWGTTTTNAAGAFSFAGLPDGDYEVVVDKLSTAITNGWTITGADNRTALALGATADESRTGINFGFAPPLDLTKTRTSASPAYEGDLVTFNLAVANRLPGDGTASLKPCVYEVWAGAESAWTSGLQLNKRFTNPTNVTGAPDDVYTVSTFANAQDFISGSNFNVTGQGTIQSVEVQLPLYTTGTIGDESALIEFFYEATPGTVSINTPAASSLAIAPATLSARNGAANKGTLTWNITGLRSWSFADFANAVHLRFSSIKTGSANSSINLDSIGLKITTDALCGTVSADTTLDPVPLTDTYDADLLQFVSASLQPTTNTTTGTAPNTNGTLTWSNVGPIYPGGTRNVVVTFRALQPVTAVGNTQPTTNSAAVSGAKVVSGRNANDDTSSATVQTIGTGSISGVVWSNQDGDWVGTLGYETGEPGIPGVTVRLFVCQVGGVNFPASGSLPLTGTQQDRTCTANQIGGTWVQVGTQSTSATGSYNFTGLRPGFYYVDVNTATVPGSVANNAERDTAASDQNGPGRGGAGVGNSTWGSTANTLTDGTGNAVLFNFLSTDEDIPNVSFGYPVSPVIYGNVWQDYNANTTKDAVDAGINAVTVYLCTTTPCNAGNAVPSIGTTTTDSSGNYRFSGLTAGTTYFVSVNTGTLPAGSTWTQTAESDGTPLNNTITIATIAAGAVSGSHDFGFTRSGAFSIGDTLYYDWDGDTAQDANEEGIRNVTVYLYEDINNDQTIDSRDALVATTTTNQSGVYTFANRANGNYYVVVDRSDPDLPSAYLQTQDPDETGRCVTCNSRGRAVVSGANITTQDFGYLPEGTLDIGDTVWYDANGDGVQSGVQEIGLANVTVNLRVDFNGDGTFVTVRSTVTDASGKYLFADLPSGSYQVVVDTADADIPNDAFGNNYAATTPATREITLTNADNLTADFGFTALAAIGDTVYYDTNNNGQQDYSEPGVAGVTVSLTNVDPFTASDGTFYAAGAFNRTTTTSASGKYLFSGLPAVPSTGSGVRYTVTVTTASGPLAGRPQTADPDRDGETCADEEPITLAAVPCNSATTQRLFPGSNFMGADFGYEATGVLGDTLWIDANGNGYRDAGEYGIPYVTIALRNCGADTVCFTGDDGATITTATDANGEYLFSGLANGTYRVSIDTADLDLTKFTDRGLVLTYEPNTDTLDNAITVTMAGGVISQVDGTATPSVGTDPVTSPNCAAPAGSCSFLADFGYRFFSAVGFSLSGTVCQDINPGFDGLCDADANGVATGEAPFSGETIWLYRWTDIDGDNVLDSGEAVLAASTTTATVTETNPLREPGDYRFEDLPPATGTDRYIVSLAAPTPNLDMTTTGAGVVETSSNGFTTSAYRVVALAADVTNQDFAFISPVTYDFGDLPDSYSTTLQGSPDGARHTVSGTPTLYLGSSVDGEGNGQASANATGDDTTGSDDENGVAVPSARWVAGPNGGSVSVTVSGSGYLVGWIDFSRDGDFADSGEMIISRNVNGGTDTYSFTVPAGLFPGGAGPNITLSARFRLFSAAPTTPQLAYSGASTSGEVEDYRFVFTPNAVTLTTFSAEAEAGGPVTLSWRTSAELGVAGFHILRSDSGERDGAERITPELIEAVGDSVSGAAYSWVDKRPAQEGTRYWLEVVNIDGTPEEYGPVAAAPQVGNDLTTRLFLPLLGR